MPAATMPARNSAGNRKRSERNMGESLGRGGVLRGRDLVADAPYRHDRRRVPELAPQLADVHVHGAGVPREGVAPDPLEQLVACQNEAAMVEQFPEQVELLRRELDLL